MNAFTFPPPPPSPEAEALRLEVRHFLRVELADRKSVEKAESWTGMDADFSRTMGQRGWIGDNPFIFLDTRRIRALGWAPRHGIRASVEATLDWLTANPWILEAKP